MRNRLMQHQPLIWACSRVLVGMFAGVLLMAAQSAFADDAGSSGQNASTLPGGSAKLSASAEVASVYDTAVNSSRSFLSGLAGKTGNIVTSALDMIGVRYRWGGNSPDSGLDCSGFVRYVFKDTLGLVLPRRAEEMGQIGERVSMNDLKPGDLVFFNTMHRAFSHVGIYIGNNRFVHSPSTGSTVRVDNLDASYWENHFTEARRVVETNSQQQEFKRVNATFTGNTGSDSRNYSN